MNHPPGTVGVVADDISRYSAFSISLSCLDKPPGTRILFSTGRNIAKSANRLVEGMTGDWLFLLGDDHVFPGGLLYRLLDHEADVVCPVGLMRQHPYPPVLYEGEKPSGEHIPLDIEPLPPQGLHPVWACGGAGMLIRRHVLDKLEPPWFEYGHTENGRLGEDLTLCRKIREAGYQIQVDLGAALGHLSTIAVWPRHVEGEWRVHVDFNSGAPA